MWAAHAEGARAWAALSSLLVEEEEGFGSAVGHRITDVSQKAS
jgi:hypothetical protein